MASSLNATTHGVLARTNVLPGVESEEEWERFREDLFSDLNPVGKAQEEIVHEIAGLMWRKRRLGRLELACFDQAVTAAAQAGAPHPELVMPAEADLQKVARYEAHLTRDLQRCLRILKDLRTLPRAAETGEQRKRETAQHRGAAPAFNLEEFTNTLVRDADAVIARGKAARTTRSTSDPSAPSETHNCETNSTNAPAPPTLTPTPALPEVRDPSDASGPLICETNPLKAPGGTPCRENGPQKCKNAQKSAPP